MDYAIRTLEIELARLDAVLRLAFSDAMQHKCEIPGTKSIESQRDELLKAIDKLKVIGKPDFQVYPGNVIRNLKTGKKFVTWDKCMMSGKSFEFICSRPHEDMDYSYLCKHKYCRCTQ